MRYLKYSVAWLAAWIVVWLMLILAAAVAPPSMGPAIVLSGLALGLLLPATTVLPLFWPPSESPSWILVAVLSGTLSILVVVFAMSFEYQAMTVASAVKPAYVILWVTIALVVRGLRVRRDLRAKGSQPVE